MKKIILTICMMLTLSGCTITANYDITSQVINDVTSTAVKANISITSISTNDYLDYTQFGSGVIFKELDGFYYLLTNNHVIEEVISNPVIEYKLKDYKGYEYEGVLVASEEDFDLAILKFEKVDELNVLDVATSNYGVGQKIIAIGQPLQQNNAITFGEIIQYTKANESLELNVICDVLEHSAPIYSGSSGGMLINYDYEIVGINYGSYKLSDGTFYKGVAIPVSAIQLFLKENNI